MNEFFIGVPILLAQLIEACMFIQASRGGGKSFLLRSMNEAFSGHVQQIIIDLEGEFLSLREKFPFALLAVEGGDIALNVRHAATYAKKFMESHMSVIIDLSDLVPLDREIFVRDFLHALMNLDKKLYHPLLLYIDEVAKFCPQDEDALSTAAVIDVAARGRKRDIGVILATQRISNVHKSLTSEMGNKMIGRTFQDIDQVRAGKQLGWKPSQATSLRSLKPGEFYCFGPALQDEIVKFKVPPVLTNHKKMSSKTVAPPTPKEIQAIIASLGDLPAEAEKDLTTMYGLQEEIKRLNHLIEHSGKNPISALDTVNRIKEPLMNENGRLNDRCQQLEEVIKNHDTQLADKNVRIERLGDAIRKIVSLALDGLPFDNQAQKSWIQAGKKLSFPTMDGKYGVVYPYKMGPDGKIVQTGDREDMPMGPRQTMPEESRERIDHGDGIYSVGPIIQPEEQKEKPIAKPVVTPTEPVEPQPIIFEKEEKPIGLMGKNMLQFLFTWDAGFSPYQLARGLAYSESSGSFKDALRQLRRMGFVRGENDDLYANTEAAALVGEHCTIPKTRKKLTSSAFERHLSGMERNIAAFMHLCPYSPVSVDTIAEQCGYSPTSGSFKDALRALAKMELIRRDGKNIFKNPDVPIV